MHTFKNALSYIHNYLRVTYTTLAVLETKTRYHSIKGCIKKKKRRVSVLHKGSLFLARSTRPRRYVHNSAHRPSAREWAWTHRVQYEIITLREPERACRITSPADSRIRWRWYTLDSAMYALWVRSLQMFQTAMLFAKLARNELFHANTKSWRNLFTSSPATLFTWLHAQVFISPSLSFFSRSLLLAAQRPVFLKLTTVPLLTTLASLPLLYCSTGNAECQPQ